MMMCARITADWEKEQIQSERRVPFQFVLKRSVSSVESSC